MLEPVLLREALRERYKAVSVNGAPRAVFAAELRFSPRNAPDLLFHFTTFCAQNTETGPYPHICLMTSLPWSETRVQFASKSFKTPVRSIKAKFSPLKDCQWSVLREDARWAVSCALGCPSGSRALSSAQTDRVSPTLETVAAQKASPPSKRAVQNSTKPFELKEISTALH
ncbi:hypothetical protein Bbelb_407970 [Branchiostoma belcheri]|nr:hypothetical protein Bbelb_407970 [Branchiostoma belcheri]